MIDLYYWTTPNRHTVTMFLEESGLPGTIHPINSGQGDPFKPEFLRIAPHNRIPVIVDQAPQDGGEPVSLFESGAKQINPGSPAHDDKARQILFGQDSKTIR